MTESKLTPSIRARQIRATSVQASAAAREGVRVLADFGLAVVRLSIDMKSFALALQHAVAKYGIALKGR